MTPEDRMDLVVTRQPERFEVKLGKLSLGIFEQESAWEGFRKLVDPDARDTRWLIFAPTNSLDDVLDRLFMAKLGNPVATSIERLFLSAPLKRWIDERTPVEAQHA